MNSNQSFLAAAFMILSTVIPVTVSMSLVNAQPQPPIGLFGNPNDFRPGPPIPSCNADFNQGPPNDTISGCRVTPGD
jgi:hypothetical protein